MDVIDAVNQFNDTIGKHVGNVVILYISESQP